MTLLIILYLIVDKTKLWKTKHKICIILWKNFWEFISIRCRMHFMEGNVNEVAMELSWNLRIDQLLRILMKFNITLAFIFHTRSNFSYFLQKWLWLVNQNFKKLTYFFKISTWNFSKFKKTSFFDHTFCYKIPKIVDNPSQLFPYR